MGWKQETGRTEKKKKKEIVHSGGGAEVREGADTGNIIQVDFLEELAKE